MSIKVYWQVLRSIPKDVEVTFSFSSPSNHKLLYCSNLPVAECVLKQVLSQSSNKTTTVTLPAHVR